ncbi:MAG: YdcF family protein [Syntrophobacteria bacterium]
MSYQIIKHLMLPPSFVLLVLLGGFFLVLVRLRRLGIMLLGLGILLYYGFSITPSADFLSRPLESRYPPLSLERLPKAGSLVVLGGGMSGGSATLPASRLSLECTRRIMEAVRLYHHMDRCRIVVVGGSGDASHQGSVAEAARDVLLALNIPSKRIVIRGESRNTRENAQAVRRLRLERPLILITSARHMPRAMRVFRASGMEPLPAPCDFRTHGHEDDPLRFLPSPEALSASTGAIYEYLGTYWYDLKGRL